MIRCLANSMLEFTHPVTQEKAKTKIGFCELPDWVANDPYFKLAEKHKHLNTFEGSSDKTTEQLIKDEERAAALRDEIKALEEKKERLLSESGERAIELEKEIKEEEAIIDEEKKSVQSTRKK